LLSKCVELFAFLDDARAMWYNPVGSHAFARDPFGGNMKKLAVLLLIAVMALGLNSCILDPDKGDDPPPPEPTYKDQTQPDDVLINLQLSYDNRSIENYQLLLDDDFIYYLSASDQTGYTQWDRVREIKVTGNLFDPNFQSPRVSAAESINLQMTYAAGNEAWVKLGEGASPDPVNDPWYEKFVTYSLSVKAGEYTYIATQLQASFRIHQVTVGGTQIWRIIRWSDDTGS